jgi:hypothetical protein
LAPQETSAPSKEWQLYETLASQFDHNSVPLFTFPNNDLIENDLKCFVLPERYRPYLRRVGDSFELFYPVGLATAKRQATEQLWWNRWYNAFCVYRLTALIDERSGCAEPRAGGREHTDTWDTSSSTMTTLLAFSYRKIRDDAAGRELVIFTIPRLNDPMYADAEGVPTRLPNALQAFAEAEPHIRYVDLLPGLLQDRTEHHRKLSDYFLPCDGHWSKLGNQVASELVLKAVGEPAAAP